MFRCVTGLIFFSFCVAEHRKLIPKCSNSCLSPDGFGSPNCYCDSKCSLIYNDCCLDAPYRTFRAHIKRWHNIHCVFVHGENKHFWMVETCKNSWSGHEHIREKCESLDDYIGESNDIIASVPVTNVEETVTYKNYYCSLCNDENIENLIEWQVKTLCPSRSVTEADVQHNLTFVEDSHQWGVWKFDTDGNSIFHECYLLFQRPPIITGGIRECISGMVSVCPPSWKSITTRRKCKSYVDPVKFSDGPIYRNIDCATCHNQTKENFRCYYDVTAGSSAIMLDLAMPVDLSAVGQWF